MSTSGRVDPEIQSESRPRGDCNPKRAVGMRDFSTTLPIGRSSEEMSDPEYEDYKYKYIDPIGYIGGGGIIYQKGVKGFVRLGTVQYLMSDKMWALIHGMEMAKPTVDALAIGTGIVTGGVAALEWAGGAAIEALGPIVARYVGPNLLEALEEYNNGPLSNVGRALTKHPNIIGETGNILQKLGGAARVNEAAAEALQYITMNGKATTKMTEAFGMVTDYKLPNGLGARFSAETGQFIGFLGRGIQ